MYKPKVGDLVYLEAYQSKTPYYVRVTRVEGAEVFGLFAPLSRFEPIDKYEGAFDEISECRLIEAAKDNPVNRAESQIRELRERLNNLIEFIESQQKPDGGSDV